MENSCQDHARRISKEGIKFLSEGRPHEALSCFTEAIELEPDCPWHYNWRGAVYVELGSLGEAINDFTLAIAVNGGNDYECFLNRGLCFLSLGKLRDSLNDLNRAVQIAPREPTCLINRGFLFYLMKNYEQALADYERASKINPDNHYLYYLKSLAHAFQKNLDEALLEIEMAIKAKPFSDLYSEWRDKVRETKNSSSLIFSFNASSAAVEKVYH